MKRARDYDPARVSRHATDELAASSNSGSNSSSGSSSSSEVDTEAKAVGEGAAGTSDQSTGQPLDGNRRVVAAHYNELRETGRQERLKSRILHLRNFNNWTKSQLISEYLNRIRSSQRVGDPLRVLDLCCGKGGDLLKWSKANIKHLICTDIAEVSVEQCKRRYDELMVNAEKSRYNQKFDAEFFACDATMVRLRERYRDPSMKLNLVSCQFALHYSFESQAQAECMVRNAAECLQQGGYFIATIPDAYEIMRRLRDSPDERSFGNDIYNIEFECDTHPPPIFGAKYKFHLQDAVDCPEFLVHFPTLVKLCRKYGLQLDRHTTFANYYRENAVTGQKTLSNPNEGQNVFNRFVPNVGRIEVPPQEGIFWNEPELDIHRECVLWSFPPKDRDDTGCLAPGPYCSGGSAASDGRRANLL